MGCSDHPFFQPQNNLHIKLQDFCERLDGVDNQIDSNNLLKAYLNDGNCLWQNVEDCAIDPTGYDLILVPEVLEHCNAPTDLLTSLVPEVLEHCNAPTDLLTSLFLKFSCSDYLITVPCAFSVRNTHFAYDESTGVFMELVHPEHYCWYSPYTLKQTIITAVAGAHKKIDEIEYFFIENISIMAHLRLK
jgi:hypothetical protein